MEFKAIYFSLFNIKINVIGLTLGWKAISLF